MAPWRARARRRIFGNQVAITVGQYPLEIGLAVWGFVAGVNLALGSAPSAALRVLPDGMEQAWAVLMTIAALTVTIGMIMRRLATMATGMYLFATILLAYAAAIISSAGWHRGGTVTALLGAFGIVSLLRGWWLKEQEAALVKEIARTRPKDS